MKRALFVLILAATRVRVRVSVKSISLGLSVAVMLPGCTVPPRHSTEDKTRLPLPAEGRYTFNFSDTDESEEVTVRFRRNHEKYGLTDWRADGTMEDAIRDRRVEFKGAYVVVYENGDVLVDCQFVKFTIHGTRLDWDGGCRHVLYKDGIEPAKR